MFKCKKASKTILRVTRAKCTRRNNARIVLSKIRIETGKKAFAYQGQGAIIFNKLPSDFKIETSSSLLRFKTG